MTTDSTLKFLMDLIIGGPTSLHDLTDHKYISELPRSDMTLSGTHKTIVGVNVGGTSKPSYFMSNFRGYLKSELSAQIVVLSGMGSNDSHCRKVVSNLLPIFQDAQYIGDHYRIFINDLKWEIAPDKSLGNWIGTITLGISRFDITS